MTITRENRHRFRPSTFTANGLFQTEVEPDTCSLYLRPYDIEMLQRILRSRGITAESVATYTRIQGRAASYVWWRDRNTVIPRGLLVLCAMTQDLKPGAAEHQYYESVHVGKSARDDDGLPLGYASGPPIPRSPLFPFRERDGSRWEPFDELMGANRAPRVDAWLPLAIRERLAECGTNFREQGKGGVNDPTGRLDRTNRSAGVRRLLLAYARAVYQPNSDVMPGVDLAAPLNFRGIELTSHPVTPGEWSANQQHYLEAQAQIAEATASRIASGPSNHSTHKSFAMALEAARRARELADRERFGTPDALVVPEGTTAIPIADIAKTPMTQEELRRSCHAAISKYVAGRTNKALRAIVEQKKSRKKVRADQVTSFDPDTLG